MTDDREQGVDFSDVQDLETEEYPMSNEEVVEKYGDRELAHASGSQSLRNVLGPMDDEYGSYDELKQAIFNMMGEEAEGRKGYTDRETNARDEDFEQQSF